jgi:hypothetical protein
MNPREFWQNFKMGEEQEIACNFIYDGLRNLHEMETLNLETEIFPVLYNLSIGLERMFKVAIVLVEFNDDTNVDEFEKTLITHDHITLYSRLKKSVVLDLGSVHTGLLTLLSRFYEDHRYGRFNLPQIDNLSKDKKLFLTFLHKHLGIDVRNDIIGTENSLQVKKFMGKTVKKIAKDLYSVIDKAATAKNLYTYELSDSSSKAAKVVWGDEEITFEREEITMMEVLIFLLNNPELDRVKMMKAIESLPLDPAQDGDYLHFLLRKRTGFSSSIVGEVEEYQAQIDSKTLKERLEFIKIIKDPKVGFE